MADLVDGPHPPFFDLVKELVLTLVDARERYGGHGGRDPIGDAIYAI
jgi:hypothetical protein